MSSVNFNGFLLNFSRKNLFDLWKTRHRRIGILIILLVYSVFPGDLGEVTRTSLFDAYIQVTVFVAATLLLFFSLEHFYKIDIGILMKKGDTWQVPMASLLGALPGCGGAVVVITAFARGNIRLGAMVAALIATMGDAAFLLLAKEPTTYLRLMSISIFAAVISGWTVDRFHRGELYSSEIKHFEKIGIGKLRTRDKLFMAFAAPGLFLGILQLAQVDINNFGILVTILGLLGAFLSISVWVLSPINAVSSSDDHPFTRSSEETSFVTVWVIAGFLAYEYAYAFFGLDLEVLAEAAWIFLPILAILIGFIPGCGPQVLVTTLYLNGIIPFAALIGNAISNDGDALFPAIALTPRMAVIATLYSGIPALIISYFFLFTG
ncbi:putative manganese transporter [Marine Group III euryarchaeote]|nr:putative manganese transporter [Marine Group III euryarchaeote]